MFLDRGPAGAVSHDPATGLQPTDRRDVDDAAAVIGGRITCGLPGTRMTPNTLTDITFEK